MYMFTIDESLMDAGPLFLMSVLGRFFPKKNTHYTNADLFTKFLLSKGFSYIFVGTLEDSLVISKI